MKIRGGWLLAAGAVALAARALTSMEAVRVRGDSMAPTLSPGDVLAVRALRDGEPRVGQIVVARSGPREVVKRVAEAPRALLPDEVWLEGDNPARSTDSRSMGPVAIGEVVGIVRVRTWPFRRARLF